MPERPKKPNEWGMQVNLKLSAVIAVSLAVVAGSVAYVKNGMSREVEARLLSEKAVAEA